MATSMGTFKPGVTYIYETDGNRIYAREFGKSERRVVGYTTETSPEMQLYRSEINQVLAMCERDPAMRESLDQLFVLYNLKKTHE